MLLTIVEKMSSSIDSNGFALILHVMEEKAGPSCPQEKVRKVNVCKQRSGEPMGKVHVC